MKAPQTHLTIHTREGLIARLYGIGRKHYGDYDAIAAEPVDALLAHLNDAAVTAAWREMW